MPDRDATDPEAEAGAATDATVRVDGPEHLADLLDEHPLVLVDFSADWCGPCKDMEPTIEDLARTTAAVVATVDVDEEQLLAAQCDVSHMPTLLLFADGAEVERVVGVEDRDALAELISQYAV